jgi:Putative transposase
VHRLAPEGCGRCLPPHRGQGRCGGKNRVTVLPLHIKTRVRRHGHLEQFLGRWLLHVPPARAVRVRCWGLYAHTQGAELARCRQQLGQWPIQTPEPLDGVREGETGGEAHPDCCPVRGQRLVCTALLPRAGAPPRPPRRSGSRWHERANGRGRAQATPAGTGVACRGVQRGGECPVAPRLPRHLPMVVPTAFGARDLSFARARHQEGTGVQTP